MNPRTPYQRCNELQYEQFKSVQGLVDAMRDYQRMALQKLTDTVLESILWNKVSIKLQRELKEITDGSVQKLLQRLLKAESVVEEQERRTSEGNPRHTRRDVNKNTQDHYTEGNKSSETRRRTARTESRPNSKPEMGLQSVKCFKCSKLGHVAKDCSEKRQNQSTRRIALSEEKSESQDPWLLILLAGVEQQQQQQKIDSPWLCTVTMLSHKPLAIRGPTYKADVIVDGVRVRVLLDHGAQASLVRKELLPKIREKNRWTLEQCHDKNCELEGQSTGAGGHELGATAVVKLGVMTTDRERLHQVPCYVLESTKPIWNGELKNCAMVLGTNALEDLGFCIISNDGTKVMPESTAEPKDKTDERKLLVADPSKLKEKADKSSVTESSEQKEIIEDSKPPYVKLVLEKKLCLGPQQTKLARVRIIGDHKVDSGSVSVITPHESRLAENV